MVDIFLKVGPKGQVVIPKVIRESLGIVENKTIVLTVKDKSVQIKASEGSLLVEKWEKQAKSLRLNVSKNWVHGDKLYEEEFS
ncbi:MAG: AbrB/MazE/SpoVT family DNA-binding domain-containing protein [Candidatus Micrarchaeia archaeon]